MHSSSSVIRSSASAILQHFSMYSTSFNNKAKTNNIVSNFSVDVPTLQNLLSDKVKSQCSVQCNYILVSPRYPPFYCSYSP